MASLAHPYFAPGAPRPLRTEEARLVAHLLELCGRSGAASELNVVGQCGCRACPTIFFRPSSQAAHERDIGSWHGIDEYGGVVGVSLTEEAGEITQLEIYSLDGHEPWGLPRLSSIEPIGGAI
jgi:hypothetical protein